MANLYGRLQGNRGQTTRVGSTLIDSTLETWDGEIRTTLTKDGSFVVMIGPKNGADMIIAVGNVNDRFVRTSWTDVEGNFHPAHEPKPVGV